MNTRTAVDRYIDHLQRSRNLSPHTLRAYRCDLESMVEVLGSRSDVADLSGATFVEDLDARRTDGAAVSTLRRKASTYRGFGRWLARSGYLELDPTRNMEITLRSPRRLPRDLPAETLRMLVSSLRRSAGVEHPWSGEPESEDSFELVTLVAVVLMLATGLRVGELVRVRVADLDMGEGSLRVVGKGQRERKVYVSGEWVLALVERLARHSQARLGHDYLLFNSCGLPLSTAAMRGRLQRAAERAGVRAHVTPHMLRHSAATQLIESGVDIRLVQRLLGHASLTTTQLYTHISDRALRDAVAQAGVLEHRLITAGVG